ncbi:MAG TPA: phospho-N-acetylmuramoyl-pentapeptide-transferase [Bacteroidetes bacterium]|nr:phospho-N-acetylmuramoyl-pentapeptide-transferase [Bacteroidota bacterium]
MFYHLFYPLSDVISGFNVFKYITFRAGGAAVTALLVSFIIGPVVIKRMKLRGICEEIRSDGPDSHQVKVGTPTMGGLIILPAILTGTLLFARLDQPQVWVLVIATVWMGVVGFIDDWIKSSGRKSGLVARYKLLGQITLGILIGLLLLLYPQLFSAEFADYRTQSTLPFFKNRFLDFAPFGLGFLFIIMTILVIAGTSNGVNLTDGQDGLAIGVVGIMAVGFAVLSYVTGHALFSRYLNIIFLPGSGEIAVYCAAMIGAALGFLWFNAYPAQIFMGDTGALALGAGLGTVAILTKKELFLLMLGGVLVIEALSVILQRYWFKYTRRRNGTGRRLFRMAPLHHHFELLGWPESRVVVRIWIVGILLLFLTMTSFKVR